MATDQGICLAQALARAEIDPADVHPADVDAGGTGPGCVIAGPEGAGKTTVLNALARTPAPTIRLSGVGRTVGLVFAHLDSCRPSVDDATGTGTARLRWAISEEISARGATLIVDDAHLLTDEAAAIVHSLVVHDRVPAYLACTVDGDNAAPGPVRTLWKDGHLPRIDLPPIGETEVRDYLQHILGHPVTARDVDAFTRWTRGSPRALIDLTASSLDAAQWSVISGVAVLDRRPAPPPAMLEALDATIADLTPPARTVAESFGAAIGMLGARTLDWLPLAPMIELVGMDALVEAERSGVIEAEATRIRLTVPFLADVLAHRTPTLRRATLAGDLAAAIDAAGGEPDHDGQSLAMTALLTLGSRPSAPIADRRAAARAALRLGDAAAVRELAAGPHRAPPDDPALAALLAWALITLNDGPGVQRLVHRWRDHQLPAWRGLTGFLAEFSARRRLGTRAYLAGLDRQDSGLLGALSDRIAHDGLSGAWFGWLVAETTMLVGRYADARAVLDVIASAATDDGLLMVHLALLEQRLESVVHGGTAACAAAERSRRASTWRSDQVSAAADFTCARAHSEVGRFTEALTELRDCAPFLASTRLREAPRQLIDRVVAMSTGVLPDGGIVQRPGLAPRIATPVDPDALVAAGEETLDAAWSLAVTGRADEAVCRLLAFGDSATDQAPTLAIDHFELAARFLNCGDTDTTQRLAAGVGRIVDSVEPARRLAALSDAVLGLRTADPHRIVAAADAYQDLGVVPVAADLLAHAAAAHRAAGDLPAAAARAAEARALARDIGGLTSPAQRSSTAPNLTKREVQIIELVAGSMTNQQIAERLRLSVRTVEGHLLRASAKHGVSDRAALVAAWRDAQH